MNKLLRNLYKLPAVLILAALLFSLCSCSLSSVISSPDGPGFFEETTVHFVTVVDETDEGPDAEEETEPVTEAPTEAKTEPDVPDEHGSYTTAEDVALYLHVYGRLPDNFITKKEAEALGWQGSGLEDVAPGKCIGGTYFGNYEEKLPKKKGRSYRECDIDTLGRSSRGAKRLVYSNDGLIYYTEDHYETFTQLY